MINGTFAMKVKKGRSIKPKKDSQSHMFVPGSEKKVEFYIHVHNKIKNQYRNGEFKNTCDMLFDIEAPQKSELPLFYEDQLTSITKYLKYSIIRKEIGEDNIAALFRKGKETITKFYDVFLLDESIEDHKKSVNPALHGSMTRFLNVLLCFVMKYCYFCSKHAVLHDSSPLLQCFLTLVTNVVTSSTYNYKILKKAGQALLILASLLVDCRSFRRAAEVYQMGLKNQINILLILSHRVKNMSKRQSRRCISNLYDRLSALLFNLGQIYQLQGKLYLTTICFKECLLIAKLKSKIQEKDLKNHISEYFNHYTIFLAQHLEISHIVKTYFSAIELSQNKNVKNNSANTCAVENDQHLVSHNTGASFLQVEAKKESNIEKRILKKSFSIQDRLITSFHSHSHSNSQMTPQLLFYGVKLFDKMARKERPKSLTTKKQIPYFKPQESYSQLIKPTNQHQISKLKKKKGDKRHEFREPKEPIDFKVLQKTFARMWNQDEIQANKLKEKVCLLNYKNQNASYNSIYKEGSNVFQQIQPSQKNNSDVNNIKSSKPRKSVPESGETGLNLFKSILLKNNKILSLKKSETFIILKRKVIGQVPESVGYSLAEESVNFLKKKLECRREGRINVKTCVDEKPEPGLKSLIDTVFLTKDTVQIPNLFLSYIAESSLNYEILSAILQFGLSLSTRSLQPQITWSFEDRSRYF